MPKERCVRRVDQEMLAELERVVKDLEMAAKILRPFLPHTAPTYEASARKGWALVKRIHGRE